MCRLSRYLCRFWKLRTAAMATASPEKTEAKTAADTTEGSKLVEETSPNDHDQRQKAAGGKTRKRGRTKNVDESAETDTPAKKKSKGKASTEPKASVSKVTDWGSISWSELGQTADDRPWTIKFSSWNVNGVRAWLKNGGFEYMSYESPDLFCLQETKCSTDQLPKDKLELSEYHMYWNSADKPGYSGTGLYSKVKPVSVTFGMGIEKHDTEGRLITCEYDNFYFVTAYVPNAGEGLKRLDYRQEWDKDFRAYLKNLDSKKPLILCGDLNVAHNEIDLKNPKTNSKTAGFTQQERDGFTALLAEGFVDSFRQLHPDTQAFTYWSYRFNARAKNIGWRLDYFVLSERLMKDVCSCVIRSKVVGSDHCPLVLSMAMS